MGISIQEAVYGMLINVLGYTHHIHKEAKIYDMFMFISISCTIILP
jgi:hypothetical protein